MNLTSPSIIVAILVSVGCSSSSNNGTAASGSDGGVGGGGSNSAAAAFITSYCASVATCCGNVALPSDPSPCTKMLSALTGPFDATSAQNCLDDIKISASDPKWCTSYSTPPRCSDVLAGLSSVRGIGTGKIGDPCTTPADCGAQTTGGYLSCKLDANTSKMECTEADPIDFTSSPLPLCKGDVTFDAVGMLIADTVIGGTQGAVCEGDFLSLCKSGTGQCVDVTEGGTAAPPGDSCGISAICEWGNCGQDGNAGKCPTHFDPDSALNALCGGPTDP